MNSIFEVDVPHVFCSNVLAVQGFPRTCHSGGRVARGSSVYLSYHDDRFAATEVKSGNSRLEGHTT